MPDEIQKDESVTEVRLSRIESKLLALEKLIDGTKNATRKEELEALAAGLRKELAALEARLPKAPAPEAQKTEEKPAAAPVKKSSWAEDDL